MPSRSDNVRRARPLLGTFVEIEVGGLGESAAHRAVGEAFAAVEEVQRRMSFHDPASVLSRINREAAERAVAVDAWTFEVLSAAAEVQRVSGGVFDVAVAPHLQRLGFLPALAVQPGRDGTPCRPPGKRSEVAGAGSRSRTARSAVPTRASFADVELLPGNRVRFHRADVRVDLGGIAKGFAVDQAVVALQRSGVPRGLVNAGGDLRAFGRRPHRIAVRHPENPQAMHYALRLQNAALATSAHYFAGRWSPGQTLAPIVDPRTGARAERVRSATVRAPSAMLADALTKVVMLAGEDALPVLAHFRADAIFIATDAEARCSPGWSCPAPAFA